jgi:hypothetical protein
MHVHFSKAPLTKAQRGRIHQFINAPGHRWWVEKLAGRKIGPNATYAQACPKDPGHEEDTFPQGKYEALNLSPARTCEMRIFAATTDPTRFMTNLEAVAAMVHFTQSQPPDAPLTRESLIKFASDRSKLYPAFVEWSCR